MACYEVAGEFDCYFGTMIKDTDGHTIEVVRWGR